MKRRGHSLVLSALIVMTLAACQQDPTIPPGELAPIRIGTITSLSGGLETLGPGWRDTVILATQEVNAAGGPLPGRLAEVVVGDDGTDPATGADAALKLIEQDNVVGIIGAPASSVSIAVAAVTGEAGVVQISGTSTSPELNATSESHPTFFRTVPSDALQGLVTGDATRGQISGVELNCERLAIMHNNDSYGAPFADTISSQFTRHGGTAQIVATVAIEDAQPSYSDQVSEVRDTSPDCIALVTFGTAGGTIVREWYSGGGADVSWIGGDGCKDLEFAAEAGEHAVGIYGTAATTDRSRGPYRAFAAAFDASFSDAPVVFAEHIYDATALLLLAIAQAGSVDNAAIREALIEVSSLSAGESFYGPGELVTAMRDIREGNTIDYEGAAGPIDFRPNGDVPTGYFEIWQWDGTEFVQVTTVTASQ